MIQREHEWFSVGRLSEISTTIDGQREFLEAIPSFRLAEKRGWIADSGYLMPKVGDIVVGRVSEIIFVPDNDNPNDGQIVVLKTQNRELIL